MNADLAALIRRHLQAENAHDLAGTLATLHPECRFADFATGQSWSGHEGAAAHYRQWWTCFDVEVRRGAGQQAYWAADDVYIAEATWHGRHVGRFLGIEPSGRAIVQPFVVFLSFRDGLMAGERFHYDLASLLRQIGADPIPALAGLDHRP
ncbi:MAG: ester cyclase [Alphaproteobacteria bacterium]|nr:ester cyclase [Alphaproteobacteria bacterium]